MIWFACKSCGKKHSRPESSVGTMVFCECGQGNAVPWESTIEAPPTPPEPEPLPAPPLPAAPRLEPVPVGEERVPPSKRPNWREQPPPDRPPPGRPRGRRPGPRRRDQRFCFNHEDTPVHRPCDDCREPFCAECLVEFQGAMLCGPCKNFRVYLEQRPPQLSGKALTAVLLAVLTWPIGFCLLPLALNWDAPAVTLLAVIPQVTALVLGAFALRDTERNPRISGRALAVTGVVGGTVATVLTIFLMVFPPPTVW